MLHEYVEGLYLPAAGVEPVAELAATASARPVRARGARAAAGG
jgi:hypothetical protein